MKGLILQCAGCGFSKMLNLDGDAEQIENEINQTISVEGWRYSYNRQDFICPDCIKGLNDDKLYNLYFGKAKCYNKIKSYEKLLFRVAEMLENFKKVESEV